MSDKVLHRIMLIDDDAMVHFLNQKLITKSGYQVEVQALSGAQEAMNHIVQQRGNTETCLILLDLNMPGWTGWDFLNQFEALESELRQDYTIMILSTSENPADLKRANQIAVVDQYITKPLSLSLLEEIVGSHWPQTPRL